MSGAEPERRPPRKAPENLLLLEKWEEFTGWLLDHTAKWPKSCRFTLTQRLENHALDVTELLVEARYDREARRSNLVAANLRLERMRHLLRLAQRARIEGRRGFETAMRGIDEAGRMLHGWRSTVAGRAVAARDAQEDK